jgi:uncharacterized membrane protein
MHSIGASILVNAPVAECYQRWMDFKRFPEFMRRVISVRRADPYDQVPNKHTQAHDFQAHDPQKDYNGVIAGEVMKEVESHGNQVWHWEVRGPLGQAYSWTAGIVLNIPNKTVSWASTYDQEIPTSGSVNFLDVPNQKTGKEQTLVEVKMSFSPPGGILGEFLSDIVHYGDNLLAESLIDFKSYVERDTQGLLNPQQRHNEHRPMTSETDIRKQTGTPVTHRSS